MRLGQLVWYAASRETVGCEMDTIGLGNCPVHRQGCPPADPFYVEDDVMVVRMREKLKKK